MDMVALIGSTQYMNIYKRPDESLRQGIIVDSEDFANKAANLVLAINGEKLAYRIRITFK